MKSCALDPKRLMEQSACPVCGGSSSVIDTVVTIDPLAEERPKLRRCVVCRHLFHDPIPRQELLSELYESGSPLVVPRGYQGTSPTSEGQLQRTIRLILDDSERVDRKNVLELGSGNGAFIRWMHVRAKRAIGIEPGVWHENVDFIVPDLARVPRDEKYDLIIALDVMEHLAEPIEMLRQLRALASETAVISCTFPNSDSIAARWLKARWRMIRPYGHLHYFSADSLDIAFARSGWKVIHRLKTWHGFSGTSYLIAAAQHLAHGRLRKAAGAVALNFLLGRDQWFVQARPA
jgi:2-polyprenyl-6-hydroxyphenyl methylase / 3-demethylubiquinone-9 3-methyltransferase